MHRVVLREDEAITAVLNGMGTAGSARVWEERQGRRQGRPATVRRVTFSNTNSLRSTQAAAAAGARIERALTILGEDVPEHLRHAGELRIRHHRASLDELGRLGEPPLSKDAIAGRIRPLLLMADQRAARQGIPDTQAALDRSSPDAEAAHPSERAPDPRSATRPGPTRELRHRSSPPRGALRCPPVGAPQCHSRKPTALSGQ